MNCLINHTFVRDCDQIRLISDISIENSEEVLQALNRDSVKTLDIWTETGGTVVQMFWTTESDEHRYWCHKDKRFTGTIYLDNNEISCGIVGLAHPDTLKNGEHKECCLRIIAGGLMVRLRPRKQLEIAPELPDVLDMANSTCVSTDGYRTIIWNKELGARLELDSECVYAHIYHRDVYIVKYGDCRECFYDDLKCDKAYMAETELLIYHVESSGNGVYRYVCTCDTHNYFPAMIRAIYNDVVLCVNGEIWRRVRGKYYCVDRIAPLITRKDAVRQ
jgi:hypothetical protein